MVLQTFTKLTTFSRNSVYYQCIDRSCKAVLHITRRPDHLGEQSFLIQKHTCDYLVHENFVDETLLDSCYDRYHLDSEPPIVLSSAEDPSYPPDIIDFTGDTSMLLRTAPE